MNKKANRAFSKHPQNRSSFYISHKNDVKTKIKVDKVLVVKPTPAVARIRPTPNPLVPLYFLKPDIPDWNKVFENPHQPLFIDLGCGKGHFISQISQARKDINFLGLDIHKELIASLLYTKRRRKLTNAHFICASANTQFEPILKSLPSSTQSKLFFFTNFLICFAVEFNSSTHQNGFYPVS